MTPGEERAREPLVLRYTRPQFDERDRGDPAAAFARRTGAGEDSCAISALGLHIPGVTDRATCVAAMHTAIAQAPPDEDGCGHEHGVLCGVAHVEDIGIWQTPYTGRDELRRHMARLGRRYMRPVVILHAYQHRGACPGGAR